MTDPLRSIVAQRDLRLGLWRAIMAGMTAEQVRAETERALRLNGKEPRDTLA